MIVVVFSENPGRRKALLGILQDQLRAHALQPSTYARLLSILNDSREAPDAEQPELLVCDFSEGQSPDAGYWMLARQYPMILIGPRALAEEAKLKQADQASVVESVELVEDLVGLVRKQREQAAKQADGDGESTPSEDEPEFHPVRTGLLTTLSPLKADIFIRLNPTKFLKLFQAGDEFSERDLEKYRDKKGIEYLYLRSDSISVLIDRLRRDIEAIAKKKDLEIGELAETFENVHGAFEDLSRTARVTPEIEEMTRMQIDLVVKSLRFNWGYSKILDTLGRKGGYIANHSLLLSYLTCLIANKTRWGSENTSSKLCFAAFLHDMAAEDQRLAALSSLEEFERYKGDFPENAYRTFIFHPARAAERYRQFKDAPHDVETIIIEHHEKPDGTGFPRRLNHTQINPLAAIFIVAHEFLYFTARHEGGFNAKAFVRSVKHWKKGNFAEILEAIEMDQELNGQPAPATSSSS